MESAEPTAVAGRFLRAFSAADFEGMRALLADDVVAYVTNAEGGVDKIEGRDAYLSRLEAMDLPAARFKIELTQPPVAVNSDRALVMVEIHAERGDRSGATGSCTTSRHTCSASRAGGSPNGGWSTRSQPRATGSGP